MKAIPSKTVKFTQVVWLSLCLTAVSCFTVQAQTAPLNPDYDAKRAQAAGADDYGMKKYVMAFLKRGPNRDRSKADAAELQRLHMENIGRLAAEGKLVLAGPFFGEGELRGIYIFDVTTVEEAKSLTETDPAIKAGSLVMELLPWYGSAALMELNKAHNALAKLNFN
jgi:uncharacterized protein